MKLALLALALLTSTARADNPKGWEIYSWFDMACSAKPQLHSAPNADSVCFALLPGTNRLKTTKEIKQAPLTLAAITLKLAALPKGSPVFWSAPSKDFDLPGSAPTDPRRQVVATAAKRGLALEIVTR